MGKMQPANDINFDLIVEDFDRLLPLYRFVEGHESAPVLPQQTRNGFQFKPGCTVKLSSTRASYAERELDVTLTHNNIQTALHKHLCSQYGEDNVGVERPNADGRIDVVVRQNGQYWFYEIKTALTARRCISEALAQLLEYSYWPRAQVAERLIIVGEPVLDDESEEYLSTLRQQFGIPVDYEQFDLNSGGIVHRGNRVASAGSNLDQALPEFISPLSR